MYDEKFVDQSQPTAVEGLGMSFPLKPLSLAVYYGDCLEIVRYLVEECHARHEDMVVAVVHAAVRGHVRSQAYLMSKGATFAHGPFPKGRRILTWLGSTPSVSTIR